METVFCFCYALLLNCLGTIEKCPRSVGINCCNINLVYGFSRSFDKRSSPHRTKNWSWPGWCGLHWNSQQQTICTSTCSNQATKSRYFQDRSVNWSVVMNGSAKTSLGSVELFCSLPEVSQYIQPHIQRIILSSLLCNMFHRSVTKEHYAVGS